MIHNLKIQPPFFDALKEGKNFEVRRNDRGYQKGDELFLREWSPQDPMYGNGLYTGRTARFVVTYVYSGGFGCDLGEFVVLGLGEAPEIDQ